MDSSNEVTILSIHSWNVIKNLGIGSSICFLHFEWIGCLCVKQLIIMLSNHERLLLIAFSVVPWNMIDRDKIKIREDFIVAYIQ